MTECDVIYDDKKHGFRCPKCGGLLSGSYQCNDRVVLNDSAEFWGLVTCDDCKIAFRIHQFFAPGDDCQLLEEEE